MNSLPFTPDPTVSYAINPTETELTLVEQSDLETNEATIERGLKTFVEVGNALLAIRDGRLYRQTHGTFEDYCRDRWQMDDSRARQLIGAAIAVDNLKTVTNVTPSNEGQTRPLVSLSPDDQRAAWQEALDTAPNGKLTGSHVASVAEKYKQPQFVDDAPAIDYSQVDDKTGEILDDEPEPLPITNRAYKNSSESNEWYTPQSLIDRALAVMGEIDLDPASSDFANQTVRAKRYFTIDDDGLRQEWWGRVWCNPPYGDEATKFVEKIVGEYEAGRITEGLMLVAARTDTQWFRKLRRFPRCFLWGRVRFINAETGGAGDPAGFPSMAVYFGSHPESFLDVFQEIGDVYVWWGAR